MSTEESRVGVRMDQELKDILVRIADKENRSLSKQVIHFCLRGIEEDERIERARCQIIADSQANADKVSAARAKSQKPSHAVK